MTGSYQIAPSSTPSKILLENISAPELIRYVGFDYQRFALASWESFNLAGLEAHSGQLIGWSLLKLYYSAFFAAHAITRGGGGGVAKLEGQQADTLSQIISIVRSQPTEIKGGMYSYSIDIDRTGKTAMTLAPHRAGAGVHDGFWRYFLAYLEALSAAAIAGGRADGPTFLAGVTELAPFFKPAPGDRVAWVSRVRNDINYQQLYQVWFPARSGRQNADAVKLVRAGSSQSVRLDRSLEADTLRAFMNASQYLACLNFEIAENIAARSTAAGLFGSNWRRLKAVF